MHIRLQFTILSLLTIQASVYGLPNFTLVVRCVPIYKSVASAVIVRAVQALPIGPTYGSNKERDFDLLFE